MTPASARPPGSAPAACSLSDIERLNMKIIEVVFLDIYVCWTQSKSKERLTCLCSTTSTKSSALRLVISDINFLLVKMSEDCSIGNFALRVTRELEAS